MESGDRSATVGREVLGAVPPLPTHRKPDWHRCEVLACQSQGSWLVSSTSCRADSQAKLPCAASRNRRRRGSRQGHALSLAHARESIGRRLGPAAAISSACWSSARGCGSIAAGSRPRDGPISSSIVQECIRRDASPRKGSHFMKWAQVRGAREVTRAPLDLTASTCVKLIGAWRHTRT